MKTRVSSKGRIVLPAELRKQDGIEPGQEFEIERIRPGEYLLKNAPAVGKPGLLRWLRTCPEKGWFQPLPPTSTDQL